MRALQVQGPAVAQVVTVDPPAPAPGEVIVSVATAAICNTDRKLTTRGASPGRTLGHETAGYLQDGTAVGVHPDISCGKCASCRAGLDSHCPDKVAVGIDRDGGLAGSVAVPAAHAVPLEGVPVEFAPMLEPLACCVHAVRRAGPFDGPAVVVGAGAMGIFLTWVLRAAGTTVAVCQSSAARRDQASRLGADVVLTSEQDPREVLDEQPGAIFVTAPGADALQWGLRHVATAGVVHAFAGTPGGALVDANLVHYGHLQLVGSTGSGLLDYRRARDLVRDGSVNLSSLPHRRTDLDGAARAVVAAPAANELRTLIDINEGDR